MTDGHDGSGHDGAGLHRRAFLQGGGAAAGLVLLQGCARRERGRIEQQLRRAGANPGEAVWRSSICRQCAGGCATSVRVIDGDAKKIEGDPASTVNAGGVCALGHSALQELYHPDRPLTPLRRVAGGEAAGAGAFEPATWEEALADLEPRLGGRTVVCCPPDPLERRTAVAVAVAMGAAVTVVEPAHAAVEREARRRFFGRDVELHHDFTGADCIVACNASVLDRWGSPVAFAAALAAARARGVPFVAIGPRMSLTTARADLWLPVPAAGLTGLLRALLAWQRGDDIDGGAVAAAASVPLDRLQRLLGWLAAARRPALVVGGEGGASVEDVELGHRLQQALGALPRAIDLEAALAGFGGDGSGAGGVGPAGTPGSGSAPGAAASEAGAGGGTEPAAPEAGGSLDLAGLARRIVDGKVDALLCVGVDPLAEMPASWGVEDALGGVTTVRLTSSPPEPASAPDWVLPVQTELESSQAALGLVGPAPRLGVADAVVEPRGEARHHVDVLLALARTAGATVPWEDAEALREDLVARLVGAEGREAAAAVRDAVREGGAVAWTAPDPPAPSPTRLDRVAPPLVEVDAGMLELIVFEGVRGERTGVGRPWLEELPDPLASAMWGSWIELHPSDAERLEVVSHRAVRVRSAHGEIASTAFVNPATRPGTAAMPRGAWRDAEGRRLDPLDLLGPAAHAGAAVPRVGVEVLPGDGRRTPFFGRGLRSAEEIPAGWKPQQPVAAAGNGAGAAEAVGQAAGPSNGTGDGTSGEVP